jgi:NAD-dependent deacetylase
LTGAGVSAESGIPTFRDKQTGLWERFDAAELATPEAFERDGALVWAWYEWRRAAVRNAQPNPAHRAIAAMATLVPELTLITQNVDDLHERAGSREVLHLHGEIHSPYCEKCRQPYTLPNSATPPSPDSARIEPPRCLSCSGRVRPGVVWFGEGLPQRQWLAACEAARCCDVFFCIGSSSRVQPAASLTDLAIAAGATTIQVNPNATDIDDAVTFALREPAGIILPQLLAETWHQTRLKSPTANEAPHMTYTIRVDDNFHYMDEDHRYTHGEYESLEEALKAAKAIVDSFLSAAYVPGMSPDELYRHYTSFGDDPFIIGPEDAKFSAWNYAQGRCQEICATGANAAPADAAPVGKPTDNS